VGTSHLPDRFPACWDWPAHRVATRIVGESCGAAHHRHLGAIEQWQAGRCAICAACPQPDRWRDGLVVDHDHATDLVRGLLCHRCNTSEGRSQREVFRAYRWRHPTLILGLTVRWSGGCLDASCDCYGWRRRAWLTEVVEAGITDVDQVGTLRDLLDAGTIRYADCISIGGHRCCEHGPETVPPHGRQRCPGCRGFGWDDSDPAGCRQCGGAGHLPLSQATIMANLGAAYRELLATFGSLSAYGHAGRLTNEQAAAADRARRYMTAAAVALRSAGDRAAGQDTARLV
jgi:Recombination endonuclease VII